MAVEPQESARLSLPIPILGYYKHIPPHVAFVFVFYMGAGDVNSGPRASIANTSWTKPSPQPPTVDFTCTAVHVLLIEDMLNTDASSYLISLVGYISVL